MGIVEFAKAFFNRRKQRQEQKQSELDRAIDELVEKQRREIQVRHRTPEFPEKNRFATEQVNPKKRRKPPFSKPETIKKKIAEFEKELKGVDRNIARAEAKLQKAKEKTKEWGEFARRLKCENLAVVIRSSNSGVEKLLMIEENYSLKWVAGLANSMLMPASDAEKIADELTYKYEHTPKHSFLSESDPDYLIEFSKPSMRSKEALENAQWDLEEALELPDELRKDIAAWKERLKKAEAGVL